MRPWFSVVVPVYNVEAYLRKCVDSLLAQSFEDLEIILIDDGSTDASGMICDEYASKHDRIIVVHQPNGGLSCARNTGLIHARGVYVSFVDSDDWMDHDAYQRLYDESRTSVADIINFGCRKVENDKVLYEEHAVFPEAIYGFREIQDWILPESIARDRAFDQVNLPVQLSACMCIYRLEFLQKHKIAFESERIVLCEDWLFNIRCLCRAQKIVVLHDIMYNYFTRMNSTSMSYKRDSYERRKDLYQRYIEELRLIGRQDAVIQHRLRNFWLESVYCCYIIELNAPSWDREVKRRLDRLCNDPDFLAFSRQIRMRECTIKGCCFLIITKLKMHGIMRLAYQIKKRREFGAIL